MDFVVLPDHPVGAEVAASLPWPGDVQVISHCSGRPWIVGRWSDNDVVSADAGNNKVVLFGPAGVSRTTLTERLRGVRSVSDLDTVARFVPGCFHLVSSIQGTVRIQGSISTARQVFHGTVAGVTVAADRPWTLASLTGAEVDTELIALHLLAPYGPPWPLNDACLWKGIHALHGGHYLRIDGDGTARTIQWWTPPEPDMPLDRGATTLRQTLIEAVQARTRPGQVISADLSGGMDSTSLCFLAARGDNPLITVHYEPLDPSNDDKTWADQCQTALSNTRHLVIQRDTAPTWCTPTAVTDKEIDGPTPFFHVRAMTEHLARVVSDAGASRHLRGLNGDELFHLRLACLHTFARRHPLKSIPHIRAKKAQRRWTTATTLRFLLNGKSYPRWVSSVADHLTDHRETPEGDWEIAPKMPPWATRDAVGKVRQLLLQSAEDGLRPVSDLPVQHDMIQITRVNGTAHRQHSRMASAFGVSLEAPYLDDRVVEVALSVRLEDRLSTRQFKPVLSAAMRGIAPQRHLGRSTKGDYSAEFFTGLTKNRKELLELCDDSLLAKMGLIDADALRNVLLGLYKDTRPYVPLGPTLACETWLQALSQTAGPSGVLVPRGRAE
ncbi:asparagine synthase (glutamine-hydrolysing) [Thermomonospora echinospora]|uniref:asparagine synthase (glutamine-hydrolyzing) n=1 Tax=Thermomonospora echinospora TaxID=1992 RepID=A0A1H6D159_9ACTN|nr:asparagine synthase-related protein [Thermomonospora echinospora]SEG78824.1 asparagine synthase (glutamine-hydrolysing) [Thermomonospora echinospora]